MNLEILLYLLSCCFCLVKSGVINRKVNKDDQPIKRMSIEGVKLQGIASPIKTVESLSIEGELEPITVRLPEIFPNVRELTFNYLYVPEPAVLSTEFLHLERVNIVFLPPPFNGPQDEYLKNTQPAMRELFENNPQIRTLSVTHCSSLSYLRIASAYLPNLEELHVNFAMDEIDFDEKIHFPKVKRLVMQMGPLKMSDIISFDQLEQLNLVCKASECVDFTVKNEELTKVHIVGDSVKHEDVAEIIAKLPNLKKFLVKSTEYIENDFILPENSGKIFDFKVISEQSLYESMRND